MQVSEILKKSEVLVLISIVVLFDHIGIENGREVRVSVFDRQSLYRTFF